MRTTPWPSDHHARLGAPLARPTRTRHDVRVRPADQPVEHRSHDDSGRTEARDTWDGVRFPRPFRVHQRQALEAIDRAFATGAQRAWVVLPPGAGKTLVGLEAARRLRQPIVAFGPNTAIQGQWLSAWREFQPATIPCGTSRALDRPVTALTYQALATFDPDAEVDEEGHGRVARANRRRRSGSLLDQLHENGRAVVEALENAGPVTLILDECHHLLEVWGRLLAELLEDLPDAYVIGLTGTPPDTLSSDQAALVDELFGPPLYSTSIPAVVREGHLAPFAELAWFTAPTPAESQWLGSEAERFAQLQTDLLEPGKSSVGFLTWLDGRFVTRAVADGQGSPTALAVEWPKLERDSPELAGAALRFHYAGLLALPPGAVLREEHRHRPTAEDWVALLGDYVKNCLAVSSDPRDETLLDEIRAALPSVGFQLTKRGIRRGRSPVDRVLARSEAKTMAAVEILALEEAGLGERLRGLVLCDHERATATLPPGLRGVLDAEAGSARLMLANLLADERTARLDPVLITGRAVAADAATARKLTGFVAEHAPEVDLAGIPPEATGIVEVTGRWTSRRWVPLVTRFFESGDARILVGTRALLGEGWDAAGVNTLVDLTTATTPTAVVQTRGRALRVDPQWPEKVANNWTVVCVSEAHPGGDSDWKRFVRKHHGYFGVTDSGEIASGVTHVDPSLSPYEPPAVARFDEVNVVMGLRAENRAGVRELWKVGAPYEDELLHTIRVTPARRSAHRSPALPAPGAPTPPLNVPGASGPTGAPPETLPGAAVPVGVSAAAGLVALAALLEGVWWRLAAGVAVVAVSWWLWHVRRAGVLRRVGRQVQELATPPPASRVAYAVADALHHAGLSPVGAAAVACVPEADGEYRIALSGVDAAVSRTFAEALDEVLSPLGQPRYVIPRFVLDAVPDDAAAVREAGRRWLAGELPSSSVVYHAVPAVLGANADLLRHFRRAWHVWISEGEPVRTSTPEGEGIMLTHRGADPFAVTTRLRVAWR